mmetsp:Transcript_46633/g.99797  ORF Transcript_46633/g.99797 Transcript_46633/m.99797 type:complete len:207 (+) Transcript_46633:106-726(+)
MSPTATARSRSHHHIVCRSFLTTAGGTSSRTKVGKSATSSRAVATSSSSRFEGTSTGLTSQTSSMPRRPISKLEREGDFASSMRQLARMATTSSTCRAGFPHSPKKRLKNKYASDPRANVATRVSIRSGSIFLTTSTLDLASTCSQRTSSATAESGPCFTTRTRLQLLSTRCTQPWQAFSSDSDHNMPRCPEFWCTNFTTSLTRPR